MSLDKNFKGASVAGVNYNRVFLLNTCISRENRLMGYGICIELCCANQCGVFETYVTFTI